MSVVKPKKLPQSVSQNALRRRMSPEEYAEYMGVSRTTVYRMLKTGRIEDAIKFGSQWRINPHSSVR